MTQVKFPSKRADGSFSVSARFSVSDERVRKVVEDNVSQWVRKKVTDDHVDFGNELTAEPHLVALVDNRVDVVFDGRPGSRRWKDWMISIVQELTSSVEG